MSRKKHTGLRKGIAWRMGLLFAMAASGCATYNDRYSFPPEISFVWDDGANTYLVPRKGTQLAKTVFTMRGEIPLEEDGAYFKVNGTFRQIVFSDANGNPIEVHRK